ncbi:MAG: hydrogenase subunit MbhD domain-containing protein [Wenzhouxiangellaceae bacterium]|nr:hydrogenase subunit MbhD domain-containing protein [Wenzhouxiangellaceae bacterium]
MTANELFDLIVLALMIACVVSIARSSDLVKASILFSVYSLALCLLWVHRGAPDVAMTEAAVGAGLTVALFLYTIARVGRDEK